MKSKILLSISLASLVASAAQSSKDQLATSINEARAEATRTSEQLKATLSALNALVKQTKGDLRPAYNTFATQIPKTEAAADWTRLRVQWMAGDGLKYFKDWQKTIDEIANASLRKKAQKRLDTVKTSYDKVEVALREASDKFKPFISDLNDIQKTLAADVTPGGIKAVRSTEDSANGHHKSVNNAVNTALKEMGKMEKSLSSEAQ